MNKKILEVKNVSKSYPIKSKNIFRPSYINVIENLSFDLYEGEIFGIVGESGSGKTSLSRIILGLEKIDSGSIYYKGKNIGNKNSKHSNIQAIFQDPYSSLNPRMKIAESISEPLDIEGNLTGQEKRERIEEVISLCGLNKSYLDRYPHEFSGGQRQRICIARAISAIPELLICDEAVSALDVSVQSQILNLFLDIRDKFNLTYIFISHDLNVIYHISDRIAVMYLGDIVEQGRKEDIFKNPCHPYTKLLLDSVLDINLEDSNKNNRTHSFEVTGCKYVNRCKFRKDICFKKCPSKKEVNESHFYYCHF